MLLQKQHPKHDMEMERRNHHKKAKKKSEKRAKIIVRNLPFKNLTEEKFKKFFEEYGDIESIDLLKRNGKFVGCGFVQFSKVQSAAKAIHHANGKKMAGRQIIVDWAVAKNTYLEKLNELEKEADCLEVDKEIKSEPLSDDEVLDFEIDKSPSNKFSKFSDNEDEEDEDEDEDSDISSDEESDGDVKDVKPNIKTGKEQSKSNDVGEGKTIFIKNIPFSVTNPDLKKCFSKYGGIEYALICIDPLTEHSKGTGFVKFKEKESATDSIKDSGKILLQDSSLEVTLALSKEQLEDKKKQKHVPKDSRNLYLIREGAVLAGSKAAQGVSASDMAKRLQIEQWKNQILKNLNMFVSRTRLVIHNLPLKYNDEDLKSLFLKHSNPNAVVREARVMRDRKNIDQQGVGASKEVGFVSFTNHEDALTALRNINNNPTIFSDKKRPIVGFSVENKTILNLKQKRIERSRVKLGMPIEKTDKLSKLNSKQRRAIRRKLKIIEKRKESKKQKPKEGVTQEEHSILNKKASGKRKLKAEENGSVMKKSKKTSEVSDAEFLGVQSEPGKKIKVRSRYKLKTQVAVHKESIKKEKKAMKERKMKERRLERIKEPRQKKGKQKVNDDEKLSKLISQYKEKIEKAPAFKKWYES